MRIRRKKLLLTAVCAVLFAVAASVVMEWMRIEYWVGEEHRWRTENLYAYQRAGRAADVLLLGTSRTLEGISARHLEAALAHGSATTERGPLTAFNLAQPFGTALQNAIILGDVVRSNGCPRAIVLDIGPAVLSTGVDRTDFIADHASLADLSLLGPDLRSQEQLDAFLASGLKGWMALYRWGTSPPAADEVTQILEDAGSHWGDTEPDDYPRIHTSELRSTVNIGERFLLRRFLTDFAIGGAPVRGLEEIRRIASDCDAYLFLHRIPALLPPDLRRLAPIEAEFQRFISGFSDATGLVLHDPTLDDVGLEPEDFQDFLHLNYTGAERYSRFLAQQLLDTGIGSDRREH